MLILLVGFPVDFILVGFLLFSTWPIYKHRAKYHFRDLGFSEVGIRYPEKTKVFLFISEKKIAGFLLAESIEQGYRVMNQKRKFVFLIGFY